jgi:hypothetical protein
LLCAFCTVGAKQGRCKTTIKIVARKICFINRRSLFVALDSAPPPPPPPPPPPRN